MHLLKLPGYQLDSRCPRAGAQGWRAETSLSQSGVALCALCVTDLPFGAHPEAVSLSPRCPPTEVGVRSSPHLPALRFLALVMLSQDLQEKSVSSVALSLLGPQPGEWNLGAHRPLGSLVCAPYGASPHVGSSGTQTGFARELLSWLSY